MFSLQGKSAIITGGGSGIGRAIALLFGKQGAQVHVLDLDEAGASETVAIIANSGGEASFRKCNVASYVDVRETIAEIASIDIVVNNAGIAHIGTAENTSEADFERLISVNIKGVFHVVQNCLPKLKERGGVILNMASVASSVGLNDRFAYSMTKGAVVAMTLSIAKDFVKHNIRCNCISPARVHTPFVDGFLAKNYPGREAEMFDKLSATQPIGRMGRPEEIATLALYLCSDEASFVTGCDYPIDGGFIKLNT